MKIIFLFSLLALPFLTLSCNSSSGGGGGGSGGGKGFFGEQAAGGGTLILACQFSEIVCGEFVSMLKNQTKSDLEQICVQSGGQATANCAKPKGGFICTVPEVQGDHGAVNYYISQGTIEEFRGQCEQSGGKITQL